MPSVRDILLKAANKTGIILLLNIFIGFALSYAWTNTNLMNYWLTFMLARYIFTDQYYDVLAKEIIKQKREIK